MAAARSATAGGTSPASQRLRDLPVWHSRTASSHCFCSAVREEMPWTPMSSSAALTPIQHRHHQLYVWDEHERDGLVLTMTAANAVHPSGDVQVVLTCVDSPPAGLNTCIVDMPNAETSTLAYQYQQYLISHHPVQN